MQYLGSESLGVIVKSDWARHDVTLSVAMTLDWLCCVKEGGGLCDSQVGVRESLKIMC